MQGKTLHVWKSKNITTGQILTVLLVVPDFQGQAVVR